MTNRDELLARYPDLADPKTQPRHTGVPTFMRAPSETDLSKVDRMKFRDCALRPKDRGIYVNPSAKPHSLSSIVHTDKDGKITKQDIAEVLDEMA